MTETQLGEKVTSAEKLGKSFPPLSKAKWLRLSPSLYFIQVRLLKVSLLLHWPLQPLRTDRPPMLYGKGRVAVCALRGPSRRWRGVTWTRLFLVQGARERLQMYKGHNGTTHSLYIALSLMYTHSWKQGGLSLDAGWLSREFLGEKSWFCPSGCRQKFSSTSSLALVLGRPSRPFHESSEQLHFLVLAFSCLCYVRSTLSLESGRLRSIGSIVCIAAHLDALFGFFTAAAEAVDVH